MTADFRAYSPGQAAAAESAAGANHVRRILTALSKYVHGKKIYAKNNPTLARFASEFQSACQAFFETEGELVLTVDQYELRWRDEVVYQNEKRDESLAFILYKDGIGELTIQPDVPADEMERLVDLLKDEVANQRADEDVVTRFWRADFGHITYRVLDEYLVGEFGEGQRPDPGAASPLELDDHEELPSFADKGRVIVDAQSPIESIDAYIQGLAAGRAESEEEVEQQFQAILESFFTISSEELKLCQGEIQRERGEDQLVGFLAGVLDFLLLQDNPSAVRDVSNIVESIVDYVVTEGVADSMRSALRTIRNFKETHDLTDSVQAFFETLEERFSDTNVLLSIGSAIDKRDADATEVFAYYRGIGRRAVPALVSLMETLQEPRHHEQACEVLAEVAAAELPQIVERFDLDNPKLARDAVRLLSSWDTMSLPGTIRQLAFYPDARVREDVVRYLNERRTSECIVLLMEMLSSEDKQTRLQVLSVMQDIDDPVVTNRVRAMALDREFAARSSEEQDLVFTLFGEKLGTEALPHIQAMLDKKGFLGLGRQASRASKLLALRALSAIGDGGAKALLRKLSTDSDNLVRSKAKHLLKRSSTDGAQPPARAKGKEPRT